MIDTFFATFSKRRRTSLFQESPRIVFFLTDAKPLLLFSPHKTFLTSMALA